MTATLLDQNQPVWKKVAPSYREYHEWMDDAERLILHQLADQVRGKAILDVGVGAGRSAWFLRLLSSDYQAIDYSPAMIDLVRDSMPWVTSQVADARALSFPDNSFDLVFFSNAGLDSMAPTGRAASLREFTRVLTQGGTLVYSTLNRMGPFYQAGPGPIHRPNERSSAIKVARFLARAATRPIEHVHAFQNVRRHRHLFEDHGSWAIDTMPTHEWSLVVHYVTTAAARAEAKEAGLEEIHLVSREGREIGLGDDATETPWFYVVASAPRQTAFTQTSPGADHAVNQ